MRQQETQVVNNARWWVKLRVDESTRETLKFIHQAMMWFGGFALSYGNLLLFCYCHCKLNICGAFCDDIDTVFDLWELGK